jgi:hypothetical protein
MSLSLIKSVRNCTVDTGEAKRIQSDRFFNPNNAVCPTWNGLDNTGRVVCPDSFYTKSAGCNSAEDRVMVENNVSRPYYFDLISLNAAGLRADIYGNSGMNKSNMLDANFASDYDKSRNQYTGNFGLQWSAQERAGCTNNAYERRMAEMSSNNRSAAYVNQAMKSYNAHNQQNW